MSQFHSQTIVLRGARLFDGMGTNPSESQDVVIVDQKIVAIESEGSTSSAGEARL